MPIEFDLPDLHPSYERLVVDTLRGLDADYPYDALATVRLYRSDGDWSIADATTPGLILLNARWFASPIEEFQAASAERDIIYLHRGMYPVHWHGDMAEPQHILAHEFGHLLSDRLPWWRQFAEIHWAAACADPVHCRPVSGYALCNVDEFWADTFAAMRLHIDCETTRLMADRLHGAGVAA